MNEFVQYDIDKIRLNISSRVRKTEIITRHILIHQARRLDRNGRRVANIDPRPRVREEIAALLALMDFVPLLRSGERRCLAAYHDLLLRAYFSLSDVYDEALPEEKRQSAAATSTSLWQQVRTEGQIICRMLQEEG